MVELSELIDIFLRLMSDDYSVGIKNVIDCSPLGQKLRVTGDDVLLNVLFYGHFFDYLCDHLSSTNGDC